MRKVLTLAIALVLLSIGFVSPVGAQDDADIVVLLPDSASSARWENDDRRFFEAAFDEAGVSYSIVNAEGDQQTQFTQAEQAITNGAQVLLLVNLDSGSGAAIIGLARDAGVAVIDYDRLTIEGDGADFYVSFDNEAVGRLQGEGLVAAVTAAQEAGEIDETPQVAVLNGSPTDNNATLFANGYRSVIDPFFESGDWELVAEQSVPDWDNQQALLIFEQMLIDNETIEAAIAANDGLAQAVISATQNAEMDFIPVTGQDATVGGIQNVLAGRQSMTVYKAIRAEASAAAELAIALLNGEDTSGLVTGAVNNGTNDIPSVLLTPVSVTSANVGPTVIADGFRTWDEICVDEFADFCPGNIAEVASGNDAFTTLVAAADAAGLVETLMGEGPYTVFAPTNDAFAAALESMGMTAEELLASEDLGSILTYHVVPAQAYSTNLSDGMVVDTVNGGSLTINVSEDGVTVNGVNVVIPDVAAINGVIHVIDGVLLPE